jgi:hypothetical protein
LAAGSVSQLRLQIPANPLPTARQGEIDVNGSRIALTQEAAPCVFTITPTSRTSGALADSGTVAVAAPAGCAWTAASNVPWITVTSGATGNGNGSVGFNVAANDGDGRSGTLTIAGHTFTVRQGVECEFSVRPTSQSIGAAGGMGAPVSVEVLDGCTWTAISEAPWITVTSGATGNGNGTVRFSIAANTGLGRTGTLTIAERTVTVTQAVAPAACTYTITPASQSIGPAGGAGTPVAVATEVGCVWTAASGVDWITVTAGATGSASGVVAFNVAANTGPARTGTLTIAGRTFTVTQPAVCTYAISPTSRPSVKGGIRSETVTVTAAAGCAWTATSNVSWITVTSGATGSGNGTVVYSVEPNPGTGGRTGTLTIAGRTFTVTQAG